MNLLLRTQYIYEQNGRQEFVIEVYHDGGSYVGYGMTTKGAKITGDVRVTMAVEDVARLDGIDAVVTAVQGLIIRVIHAHTGKGGLHKS